MLLFAACTDHSQRSTCSGLSLPLSLLTWPRSVRRAVWFVMGFCLNFFFKIVQWKCDPGPQVRRSHAASLKGPLVVGPGNEIEKGPVSEFQTRPVYFHTGDLQHFHAVPRKARKGRRSTKLFVALLVLLDLVYCSAFFAKLSPLPQSTIYYSPSLAN